MLCNSDTEESDSTSSTPAEVARPTRKAATIAKEKIKMQLQDT
jgi:hypothetical protein